ncbi:MAG: rod-binding protein [Treponema sp.]|nr:rod-binding protein [Candidatus Treponema equifaecale]
MTNVIGGYSSITNGQSALTSARISSEKGKFDALLSEMKSSASGSTVGLNVSSDEISNDGRLNGDYTSGFSGAFKSASDKASLPVGAAANQANPHVQPKTIDRTSKLYEKSLEMESYIVKNMLSSMRKTVMKADSENSYAKNMYEDMLYDEYATMMTKNAGFGLADQMYLQLSQGGIEA